MVGSPAQAGIGPNSEIPEPQAVRFPRASGDRPQIAVPSLLPMSVPPRKRG